MSNATQIKGAWTMDKIEAVLGNFAARSMMSGRSIPVTEKVLARLAAR